MMKSEKMIVNSLLGLILAVSFAGCSSDNKASEEVVNTAPVAQSRTLSIDEDADRLIKLSATDAEGDALNYRIFSQPEHGVLGDLKDATVEYKPAANYSGTDAFTYVASDYEFESSAATVEITVIARNDRPQAENTSAILDEDTSIDIILTASDIDGDALSYRVAGKPQHGTVSNLVNNISTYTPDENYFGVDTFGFIANDGKQDSITATVTVTINPVNDEPVPTRLLETTAHDSPVQIELVATDADGDALTYEIVGHPTSGALNTISNGTVIYTPGKYYTASDTFVYLASDGESNSRNASVTVTITQSIAVPPSAESTIIGDSIQYSWSPVAGVDDYSVCYAQQTISNITECKSLYGGQYFDAYSESSTTVEFPEKGRPYFFRVAANKDGLVGKMSDEAVSTLKMTLNDSGSLYSVDNQHGRDVTDADDSDGALGFSFTKLSSDGVVLTADAQEWNCIQDNVTGLVWENKTTDGGLHDMDNKFTWYSADLRNNGGNAGDLGEFDVCSGYSADHLGTFCNTEYFVNRVNTAGLCGRQNWRLPTADELISIVMVSSQDLIDKGYFPNNQLGGFQEKASYWTSLPGYSESSAWVGSFSWGDWWYGADYQSVGSGKSTPNYVRLISSK